MEVVGDVTCYQDNDMMVCLRNEGPDNLSGTSCGRDSDLEVGSEVGKRDTNVQLKILDLIQGKICKL